MRVALAALLISIVFGACGASYGDPYRRDPTAHGGDSFQQAVTARAQVAMRCDRVRVRIVGGGGYVAYGCDSEQSYTCTTRPASFHREVVCAPDGPPREVHQPAHPSAPAVTGPTLGIEDTRIALEAVADCGAISTALTLTISATGEVQRIETPGLSSEVASCVVVALRSTHFPEHGAERTGAVPLPNVVVTRDESRARAYVDGLRDVILACTNGSPIAVRVSWDADGALAVRLPDGQTGTPQDGCIRSAAASGRLEPAPQSAGSVLHAVH